MELMISSFCGCKFVGGDFLLTRLIFCLSLAAKLMETILPPQAITIHDEWADRLDEFQSRCGAMICDLDQHPAERGAPSGRLADWPVLYTHGLIASLSTFRPHFRLATSWEHMAAMGFHVNEATCQDFDQTSIVQLMRPLSPGQRKRLIGNSMNLVTQAAFMWYVIGNVVPREFPRVQRSLPAVDDNAHEINPKDDV